MSNRLVHGPCVIGAARLILACVCITVLSFDECHIHRHSAGTVRVRLCWAIAISDGRFRIIGSEPSRLVDDLFELLEICVHIRAIYVVFDGKRR